MTGFIPPRPFVVRLRHDKGQHTITVNGHSTARSAVASLLKIERAPESAVVWVKVRPVCDTCDQAAKYYVRDSGDGTPICGGCAKDQYSPDVRRASVGKLGISRFLVIDRAEWCAVAA